jgi:hypothetical protein
MVVMEPRAEPRLERIQGLWRNGVKGTRGGKGRPGRMTDFIRQHGLLPGDEIDRLVESAAKEILQNQHRFANGLEIPDWHDFLESFTPEDEDQPSTGPWPPGQKRQYVPRRGCER